MAGRNEITDSAFAEIMAPSVPSTSHASSSTSTKKVQYDVFINHRGPDTKQTLAASIYRALKLMDLRVFLDDPELDLGDSIPSEIHRAITTSFLHIAILSPRYAESTWCLEELSLMLKTGQKVIPVFYDADVNHVRWIKGKYAEDFAKLERTKRYDPKKIEDWKSALQTVSYLKGHIVNSDHDKEVLDKEVSKIIAHYVLEHPKKTPFVMPEHPVGLDKILQEFERSMMESSKDVTIMGITGMGGCGKTTLAKKYYNKMIRSFYRCSFVSDVRDVPNKKMYKMQKKLFQDLGGSKDVSIDSVEEGKAILAEHLNLVRVLIILDKVDHQDQLESFLPTRNSLSHGSVVVVVSRDPGILISWGIPSNSIYRLKNLGPKHAMELFCWHAFKQTFPIDGFECLAKKYLIICKGLPLSIKVLGALVHGKGKEFWNGQLEKFSRSLHPDIKTILMVSFEALDGEEKEIFLDISCFFRGAKKDLAIAVWEESRWSWEGSLETLIAKCLVEVDGRRCLRMHDLLRDLGINISLTWSPYRLWSSQQITHIENQGKENTPIRGIKVENDEFYEEFMEFFRESGGGIKWKRSLKILDVENKYFKEELSPLSEGLVSLRWGDFPHTALPSWVSLKKLRSLELLEASKLEEPWSEEASPPVQLRVLNIINARNLKRFPRSIGLLKNLTNIYFDGNGAPIEGLPDEFCSLQSLERLVFCDCHNLESLPSKFGDLTNLQNLKIERCCNLQITSEALVELSSLESLTLSECPLLLKEFVIQPNCSSSTLDSLKDLSLTWCGVEMISISTKCCSNLQYLHISQNPELVEIESLPISLETFELSACSNLPCVSLDHGLVKLTYLLVEDCEKLCKIQGLENCSSLDHLVLCNRGVLPVIRLNEKVSEVGLVAQCHITAFEPLLQSLNREKWPSVFEICANGHNYSEPGVEAMVGSLPFSGVTLVDSLRRQKTYTSFEDDMSCEYTCWEYVFSGERSANAAVMICLLINSTIHDNSVYLEMNNQVFGALRGESLYIGVFLQSSFQGREVSFSIKKWRDSLGDDIVQVGVLAMGEDNKVVDSFYKLVQHLGKAGDISETRPKNLI